MKEAGCGKVSLLWSCEGITKIIILSVVGKEIDSKITNSILSVSFHVNKMLNESSHVMELECSN